MKQIVINNILAQIKADGYRLTEQKKLIIKIIVTYPHKHMRVDNIYNYARMNSSDISLTTVYRIVKFLVDNNILRKLAIHNNNTYYELIHADAKIPHPHFICQQCGKIFDINLNDIIPKINDYQNQISEKYNFKISSSAIFYYGIGPNCREQHHK